MARGAEVEADLRAALAQEQLDLDKIDSNTVSTVKILWTNRDCRTKLRGELASFTRAKIHWTALLRVYDTAEKKKEDGETAVRVLVESKGLTFGAASAVSRFVFQHIQVSHGTGPLFLRLRVQCTFALLTVPVLYLHSDPVYARIE